MDELRRLWREHREAEYPDGYRDKDVSGVALILLDADIAGCVSGSLGGARLDPERARILEGCYRDAVVVTQELTGAARDYFERLKRMAAIVLEANGRRRAVKQAVGAARHRPMVPGRPCQCRPLNAELEGQSVDAPRGSTTTRPRTEVRH